VGDSDAPAEYDRDDFVGAQYPHIPKGAIVKLTLDFDGASGTAAANATVVLTFAEDKAEGWNLTPRRWGFVPLVAAVGSPVRRN
jgi:hypothetical protein